MARGDAIEVYKTLNGNNNISYRRFWQLAGEEAIGVAGHTRFRTGHLNLVRTGGHTEQRRNFWSVRSVDVWNSLQDTTKQAANKIQFKKLYDEEMSAGAQLSQTQV